MAIRFTLGYLDYFTYPAWGKSCLARGVQIMEGLLYSCISAARIIMPRSIILKVTVHCLLINYS